MADIVMEDIQSGLYEPLQPDQVRLLRLNPDMEDPETGTLLVVDLNQAPPYYALSHSWEVESESVMIQLNGRHVDVGAKLAAGIQRFRELSRDSSDLDVEVSRLSANESKLSPPVSHVWIDNLCIDQEDILERSSQVAMTGEIYKRSTRTLIWIEPDSQSHATVWQLFDRIYDVLRAENPGVEDPSDISPAAYSETFHASSGLPAWDDDQWEHLRRLMEIPWFSRIWAIQDVVLSRQDPIIVDEERCYLWSRLAWAVDWLQRRHYLSLPQMPTQLTNVASIANFQRKQLKVSLDALLHVTQVKFTASDQRDKVYGLLSVVVECQEASKIPGVLVPNYSLDMATLYQRVTRFLLGQRGSLAVLSRAHGIRGSVTMKQRQYDLGLPSWVTDWSDLKVNNDGIPTSLCAVSDSDDSNLPQLDFPEFYDAAIKFNSQRRFNHDSPVLELDAIMAKKVDQVVPFNTPQLREDDDENRLAADMSRAFTAALTNLARPGNIFRCISRFIKVTTVERYRDQGEAWTEHYKDGLAYLYNLILADEALMSLCISKSGQADIVSTLQPLCHSGIAEDYARVVRHYCYGRVFMITSRGDMGIGPSNTRKGDTVAILSGGGVPYCVREEGDHWLFVGEAFVYGLMNGEGVIPRNRGGQRAVLKFH